MSDLITESFQKMRRESLAFTRRAWLVIALVFVMYPLFSGSEWWVNLIAFVAGFVFWLYFFQSRFDIQFNEIESERLGLEQARSKIILIDKTQDQEQEELARIADRLEFLERERERIANLPVLTFWWRILTARPL